MSNQKRHPVSQLYHQFLKSKGVDQKETEYFAVLLSTTGFIIPYIDENHQVTEYTETEKLTSGENKNELFKLIGGLQ